MEKTYKINTNHLIALCHINEEFKNFQLNLSAEIAKDKDFIVYLVMYLMGKRLFGHNNVKMFYRLNKLTIDKIEKYTAFSSFFQSNFDSNGHPSLNLSTFYDYLQNNQKEISQILILLAKIKNLGLDQIHFDENYDFTQTSYSFDIDSSSFSYLSGIEIIPSADSSKTSYVSRNSNYMILIGQSLWREKNEIFLNSLVFDSQELPNSLEKSETYEKIMNLKTGKKQESTIISETVDLSVNVYDLQQLYEEISYRVNNYTSIAEKEELLKLLASISSLIAKMEEISSKNKSQVASTYLEFSPEYIEEEQKEYVRKREEASHYIWL